MRVRLAYLALLLIATLGGSDILQACGDKFLLVGRGVRFQKAYAAIHPASILIVLPPKSVKNAAVRDGRLQTALKMAGHRVEVVQQPANLTEVLSRSRHDIILAERSDATTVSDVSTGGQPKPSVALVLEEPSAAEVASAQRQFACVLKTPEPLSRILNVLDDVMKTRIEAARVAP